MRRSLGLLVVLVLVLVVVRGWPSACAEGVRLERGQLHSGAFDRTYDWFEPPGGSGGLRPLVIALHGRGGDGDGQDRLGSLSDLAAHEGFLLALPDGYGHSWHDGRELGPAAAAGVDDVAFLRALIAIFVQDHRADPRRVYLLGMSNGGFMALTAACAMADQVAAVVSVTGVFSERLAEQCAPSRPVPVAFVLGDEDPIVPYLGGEVVGGRGRILSGAASAALFARLDGCPEASTSASLPDKDVEDGTSVGLRTWAGCHDGAEVRLYTVHGGGHAWPGGVAYLPEALIGRTSRDLSASEEAWAFLRRFTLPAVPALARPAGP